MLKFGLQFWETNGFFFNANPWYFYILVFFIYIETKNINSTLELTNYQPSQKVGHFFAASSLKFKGHKKRKFKARLFSRMRTTFIGVTYSQILFWILLRLHRCYFSLTTSWNLHFKCSICLQGHNVWPPTWNQKHVIYVKRTKTFSCSHWFIICF